MKNLKIVILLVLVFLIPKGLIADDNAWYPIVLPEPSVKALISHWENVYGVSIDRIAKCESGYNQSAIGDKGKAHGMFQYHQPTFDSFAKQIGKQMDRENVYDQIEMTAWAFSKGYASHWTCK